MQTHQRMLSAGFGITRMKTCSTFIYTLCALHSEFSYSSDVVSFCCPCRHFALIFIWREARRGCKPWLHSIFSSFVILHACAYVAVDQKKVLHKEWNNTVRARSTPVNITVCKGVKAGSTRTTKSLWKVHCWYLKEIKQNYNELHTLT